MRSFAVWILATTVLCTAAAALCAPSRAAAQADTEESLADIREMILHARYDEATAAAEALAGAPGLSAAQINTAIELLATAQIATGADDQARQTVTRLYARDPQHRLSDPDASPRVASFFARARESSPQPIPVTLEHGVRPSDAREAPGVAVRLLAGADAVEQVRLSYRQGDDTSFHRIELTPESDGVFKGRVPLLSAVGPAYDVSFFIEALAPSRAVLARLGSDAAPLTLTVPEGTGAAGGSELDASLGDGGGSSGAADDGGGGIATKWWFWTLLVAVVAGGVVAAVLLGPASEGPAEGSLGSVSLGLSF